MSVLPPNPVSKRATRGATVNAVSTRFGLAERHEDGDWSDARETIDGAPAPLRTTVTVEHPKTIITRNQSPDVPMTRSINAYRGCEHGCIYCFARPSHAYHDLSPGLDFESRLFAKPSAPQLLRVALARRSYTVETIAMGTNTDPYQPIERNWKITRQCIEILSETGHPLAITTKSDRILRDLDLLASMAERNLVAVSLSVTSLDPAIAMTLEPRAAAPHRRLAAIRALSAAGIPVAVSIAPCIPQITDGEIEAIMAAARDAGARWALILPVRLPHEVAPLFRAWLDAHFPERAEKVMATIRAMRGGRDNDARYHARMTGNGPWAELMRQRFAIAHRRHGFCTGFPALDHTVFRPPGDVQGRLFD